MPSWFSRQLRVFHPFGSSPIGRQVPLYFPGYFRPRSDVSSSAWRAVQLLGADRSPAPSSRAFEAGQFLHPWPLVGRQQRLALRVPVPASCRPSSDAGHGQTHQSPSALASTEHHRSHRDPAAGRKEARQSKTSKELPFRRIGQTQRRSPRWGHQPRRCPNPPQKRSQAMRKWIYLFL